MRHYLLIFFLFAITFFYGCRSSVKEQEDKIYSRHLQRHVALTVITTPMPDKKEAMNLLLFNNLSLLEEIRVKKIIDSLYKNDFIQPLTLVAFDGKKEDYGLEGTGTPEAKRHKQFNEFIINELYPFVKKKVVIRKFNSVAVCGFGASAANAFDIAWNNDEKIQMAGMFYPEFYESSRMNDSTALSFIKLSRKRPVIKIWITDEQDAVSSKKFAEIISGKQSVSELKQIFLPADQRKRNGHPSAENFADFLIWAFPK